MTNQLLFISCADHLEPLLTEELKTLGLVDLKLGFRGIYAPNTLENIYKINYLSRLATRVLLPLAQFPCPDTDTLYNETKKIPWLDYLDETKTIAIDANINHPQIRHSLYGAQLVKDAICDLIREKKGARSSVDVKNPDLQLNIFIQKNRATLSLDTSGAPLYKRGWKEGNVEAGLPETLAAAILMRANYSQREILCDPFCGSGTFLIEAACMATQTPAVTFERNGDFSICPLLKPPNGKSLNPIGIKRGGLSIPKPLSAPIAIPKRSTYAENTYKRQALKKKSSSSTAKSPNSHLPAPLHLSSPIPPSGNGCSPRHRSTRISVNFYKPAAQPPLGPTYSPLRSI